MRRVAIAGVLSLAVAACLSSADLSGGKGSGAASGEGGTCGANLQTDVGNCGACGHVCANEANAYGTCTTGKCAIGCNTGFADCDGNAANGCEVELATDGDNCGACGHSCGGGYCSNASCEPVVIGTVQSTVFSLLLDGTDLFIGTGAYGSPGTGSVVHIDTSTGLQGNLVTGLTGPVASLAADDTNLYFLRPNQQSANAPNGAVLRAPRATPGSSATPLSSAEYVTTLTRLVPSQGNVYWNVREANVFTGNGVQMQPGNLRMAPINGSGSVSNLVSNVDVVDFAIDGADLYVISGSGDASLAKGAYRCATSGCSNAATPLPIPATVSFTMLALDPTSVFIAESTMIGRITKSTLAYTPYEPTRGDLQRVVSDGKQVYWIDGDSLFSCPADNCTKPLEIQLQAQAAALALGPTAVYLATSTDGNGSILRVTR